MKKKKKALVWKRSSDRHCSAFNFQTLSFSFLHQEGYWLSSFPLQILFLLKVNSSLPLTFDKNN